MDESLAFSLAVDLMFNGQDLDYCERPMAMDQIHELTTNMELPKDAHVAVIGAGGGRLIHGLLDRGYRVDAFEGRQECYDHLFNQFGDNADLRLFPDTVLQDPLRLKKFKYHAVFCLDDLRSFREEAEWTTKIHSMFHPKGYFIYSQVSNLLPKKKNNLPSHFDLIENINVTEDTSKKIRDSYFNVEKWTPEDGSLPMAKKALDIVESSQHLRRNIRSGVTIRYIVWRKKH